MSEWKTVSLDTLVSSGEIELGRGEIISKEDINNYPGEYPIYSSSASENGKFGEYGKYIFDEELISWSVDGGGNFFYRPKHKFSVTNVSGYLRLKTNKYIYKFLYYSLVQQHRYLTFDYMTKAHPSVIRKMYDIPAISLPQQQKIAKILSTIDETIAQTEALIEKYQQIKAGMMSDLFSRGVLPDGSLRPPREEAPELYQETPIGWIPREWEVELFKNCLQNIEAGKSPDCPNITPGSDEWGVIKVSAINPSGFKNEESKVILNSRNIHCEYEIKNGDLLISRANTPDLVGQICLVENCRNNLMLSDKSLRLVLNNRIDKYFCFYQLLQPHVRKQIDLNATGTSGSMKNIGQNSIKSFKLFLPSLSEQAIVSQKLKSIDNYIDETNLQLQKLLKQKLGLMHDLLTGKVRVETPQE